MTNDLNEFDKLIKDSLEGYEAPYDPLHWEDLEEELQVTTPGLASYFSAVTTGLVLTSVVFMGMLFFNSSNSGYDTEQEVITEEVVSGEGEEVNTASSDLNNTGSSEGSVEIASFEDERGEILEDKNESADENLNDDSSNNTDLIVTSSKFETAEKANSGSDSATLAEDESEELTVAATDKKSGEDDLNKRTGCTGMTIDFDASAEYGDDANYLWNFGDGYFSNEASPSHTFNKEGVFDVSLSVTSPSSGQITSNVVQAMIEVVEAPLANLDLEIDSPDMVTLGNKSFNASEIEWRLDNEILSSKASVNLSLADNTNYVLELVAYNEGGCTDTLEILVNSISAGSEFPRAFETAYGTTFAPGAIMDDGEVTSVKIFEKRTGNIVYEGSGSKGWNGNTPDGTKAEPGKYQWVMLVSKSNTIDIYRGEVQLR